MTRKRLNPSKTH